MPYRAVEKSSKRTYFFHTSRSSVLLILCNQLIQQECLAHSKQISFVTFPSILIWLEEANVIKGLFYTNGPWKVCRLRSAWHSPSLLNPLESLGLSGDTSECFFPRAATTSEHVSQGSLGLDAWWVWYRFCWCCKQFASHFSSFALTGLWVKMQEKENTIQ